MTDTLYVSHKTSRIYSLTLYRAVSLTSGRGFQRQACKPGGTKPLKKMRKGICRLLELADRKTGGHMWGGSQPSFFLNLRVSYGSQPFCVCPLQCKLVHHAACPSAHRALLVGQGSGWLQAFRVVLGLPPCLSLTVENCHTLGSSPAGWQGGRHQSRRERRAILFDGRGFLFVVFELACVCEHHSGRRESAAS